MVCNDKKLRWDRIQSPASRPSLRLFINCLLAQCLSNDSSGLGLVGLDARTVPSFLTALGEGQNT